MLVSGWTAAFTTAVYTFDMYNPTIAECLTFWTVAAMRIPGCGSIPKVRLMHDALQENPPQPNLM